MRFERFPMVVAVVAILCLVASPMFGQSLTTGNITGTVLDPSHAIVPGATVKLKGLDTGSTASTTANTSGGFSFSLLRPGRYQVTVKQGGFAEVTLSVVVQVGQTTQADVNLVVAKGTETIEVSAAAPLINTEPSKNTAFTASGSGAVAQRAVATSRTSPIRRPASWSTGMGGYGNFTVNGLPATSNLFTVNGENDMDPYFNINNSGASNLTLGQNEIAEATVITNALRRPVRPVGWRAGHLRDQGRHQSVPRQRHVLVERAATECATTGCNKESQRSHGEPNNLGSPMPTSGRRPSVDPIVKDKTFFFVDYEGMRFLLPNVDQVTAPTPRLSASAAENQVAASPIPAKSSTYQPVPESLGGRSGLWHALTDSAESTLLTACGFLRSAMTVAGLERSAGFTPGFATALLADMYVTTPKALGLGIHFVVPGGPEAGQQRQHLRPLQAGSWIAADASDPINS